MITSLSGSIETAPTGAKGFDTTDVLSTAKAKQFKDDGYTFCVRYLSLSSTEKEGDLSYQEADDILDAGLALMAVQHVRIPGWTPSGSLGTDYGSHAANNAIHVGLPQGVNIWLDLEGADNDTPAEDVIAYCNNWFKEVTTAGYVPGVYVGFDALLTGEQLFHSLTCKHYWKSPSHVPDVAIRGYQMTQPEIDIVRHGINIDVNMTQTDRLGGNPFWLKR
jgi:hypothetical protein